MDRPHDVLPADVIDALRRGHAIEAIKLLRAKGISLGDAKARVEAQMRDGLGSDRAHHAACRVVSRAIEPSINRTIRWARPAARRSSWVTCIMQLLPARCAPTTWRPNSGRWSRARGRAGRRPTRSLCSTAVGLASRTSRRRLVLTRSPAIVTSARVVA